MNDDLRTKNDALQKSNEKLEAEIRALRQEYHDFIDLVDTNLDEQKKANKLLFDEMMGFVIHQLSLRDTAREIDDLRLKLQSKSLDIQDGMLEYQRSKIDKYTKASNVNKQNTETLWKPYRQKFDAYIEEGKTEACAKNKIGKLMQEDGVWKKTSKKDHQKIITRPDRATLHRQLVTNRK